MSGVPLRCTFRDEQGVVCGRLLERTEHGWRCPVPGLGHRERVEIGTTVRDAFSSLPSPTKRHPDYWTAITSYGN